MVDSDGGSRYRPNVTKDAKKRKRERERIWGTSEQEQKKKGDGEKKARTYPCGMNYVRKIKSEKKTHYPLKTKGLKGP